MNARNLIVVTVSLAFFGGMAAAQTASKPKMETKAAAMCAWSDEGQLKMHLDTHVKYPVSGKMLKQACKKEAPNEFTKDEWTCFDNKLTDDRSYQSVSEVMMALGMQGAKK